MRNLRRIEELSEIVATGFHFNDGILYLDYLHSGRGLDAESRQGLTAIYETFDGILEESSQGSAQENRQRMAALDALHGSEEFQLEYLETLRDALGEVLTSEQPEWAPELDELMTFLERVAVQQSGRSYGLVVS